MRVCFVTLTVTLTLALSHRITERLAGVFSRGAEG